MADEYADRNIGLSDPITKGAAVTPSDSTVLDPVPRALWVGGTGHLTITGMDGVDVTYSNVPVGIFPHRCTKVKAATTATSIVAMS